MPEFECAQGDGIGHADSQRDRARELRAVRARAHLRDEPDPQRRGRQQAGQRDHSVHRQLPAAPQSGQQRERSALDERAAVGRGEAQEFEHVPVREGIEGRLRLGFVVAPGEAVQTEPRDRRGRNPRHERA